MLAVKGIFKNGVARPEQPIEGYDGQTVVITFLGEAKSVDVTSTDQKLDDSQLVTNGNSDTALNPDRHARIVAFERERAAYERLADSLRSQYEGLYVAIRDGQVVDSDPDELTLITRIYDRFGYTTVYIQKVGSPLPIAHIPSPRLVNL